MKYLIEERGLAWFRQEVEARLPTPTEQPKPLQLTTVADMLGWHEQGDGKLFCGVFVPQGRIQDTGAGRYRSAFREIARQLGCPIRLTPNCNILYLSGWEQNETPFRRASAFVSRSVAEVDESAGPAGACSLRCLLEKHQLAKRLTQPFLLQTRDAFQRGDLDALAAAELLSISRAQLFRLRAVCLRQPAAFSPKLSGGNHRTRWPGAVQQFLKACLPLQRPPNFQLVAEELATRFAFRRERKSVGRPRPPPLPTPGQRPSAPTQASPSLAARPGRRALAA